MNSDKVIRPVQELTLALSNGSFVFGLFLSYFAMFENAYSR